MPATERTGRKHEPLAEERANMTFSAPRERIKLHLIARNALAGALDVAVVAEHEATFGDLERGLARHLGVPESSRGYLVRARAWPRADDAITDLALRQGDEVILSPREDMSSWNFEASREPEIDVAELEIIGGPCSGLKYLLGSGNHTLGRENCEITVVDPSLSREHVKVSVQREQVSVTDVGSMNGTLVGSKEIEPMKSHRIGPTDVVTAGRTRFTVTSLCAKAVLPSAAAHVDAEPSGHIRFNRPPRVVTANEQPEIKIPAPPEEPQKPSLPLAASIAPLILGVVLFLVLKQPTMLLFMALGPVMAGWTFAESWRSGKRGYKARLASWRTRLSEAEARLGSCVLAETAQRRESAPEAGELVARARSPLPTLWERRPDDNDFLRLRVGTADLPSELAVTIEAGGSERLRTEALEIASKHATLHAVPASTSLVESGVVGIGGPRDRVLGIGRFLVAQTVTLHSPRDVVLCAAVASEEEWSWLKWLPHADPLGSPLGRSGLAAGEDASRELLAAVQGVIAERRELGQSTPGSAKRRPTIVLLVDESVVPDRSRVAAILGDRGANGVACLWLGSTRNALPNECRSVIELNSQTASLEITDSETGGVIANVTEDGIPVDLAQSLALALAPLRDGGSMAAQRRLPSSITLPELLGVESITDEWLIDRWADKSRSVPIGVSADGEFLLDLRRDGPHGLIGGTPGSGKSELLRTLVASLACGMPPNRLTFLLIDYKGKSAFRECELLPHTVGTMTNLQGSLSARMLVSLRAELQRRMELLDEHEAQDIRELERRDLDAAPPTLLIVIDEFATLVDEVPDFVDGVVDIAQRGRSLGVHLILATQRPSGVVNANVRANANLRIALRVLEAPESADIIGTDDASRISRDSPGRAFFKTGHGDLTEVQTAYVGGTAHSNSDGKHVEVVDFTFSPPRASGVSTGTGTEPETDLKRIVDSAQSAVRTLALDPPRRPFVDPLAETIPLESVGENGDDSKVALGWIDEPTRQRQAPFIIDLEADGSVLVFGSGGSGKTILLQTLASSLAQSTTVESLNIYALDYATRALRRLESLPHCGAVIVSDDEERTVRLFRMLRMIVDKRRDMFVNVNATSLTEYRRLSPDATEPRIVVLLDGFGNFSDMFERVSNGALLDELPKLISEGRPLGVHFVITAERRASTPAKLYNVVQKHVVLRLANDDEYGNLNVDPRIARGAHLPAGRGFVDGRYEMQSCILGSDASGEGQATALAHLAARLDQRLNGAKAPGIGVLPAQVDRTTLPRPTCEYEAVLGTADATLSPATIDLSESHFLVAGPYDSGRSTALATIARSLSAFDPALELHLLSPRKNPYLALDLWHATAAGVDACLASVLELADRIAAAPDLAAVVFVDDATELVDGFGPPAALNQLAKLGREGRLRLVAAGEAQAINRGSLNTWLGEVRKDGFGLLLRPTPDDGAIFNIRVPPRSGGMFPVGRGYIFKNASVDIVQVAF